jgi:hypothetical protein
VTRVDFELPYLLSIAVFTVPPLALATVAIVLALARPLPARVRGLLIAGGALLAVSRLGNAAWQAYIPILLRDRGVSGFGVLSTTVFAVIAIVELAGIALVVAAAFTGRSNVSVS